MRISFQFSPESQPIILAESQVLAYCSNEDAKVRSLDDGVMEAITDLLFVHLPEEDSDTLECQDDDWVRERITILD